jgi:hypothetical protein
MDVEFFASIFVIALRLLLPLTIFRWRFLGAILAILADIADIMILQKFGWGLFDNNRYHVFDKFFDIYYLFFEFLIACRWVNVLAKRTAQVLFIWRFLGFLLFEITGLKFFFALAPNVFEHFYLFWVFILRFFPKFKLTPFRLIVALIIVGFPKIVQEYFMHFKYPDSTWAFIRDHFFRWLYK